MLNVGNCPAATGTPIGLCGLGIEDGHGRIMAEKTIRDKSAKVYNRPRGHARAGRASNASRTCPVRFFVCPFIIARSFLTKQCTLPPFLEGVYDATIRGVAVHATALTTSDALRGFSRFHTGRQEKICLERGTALICRVVIALAHWPQLTVPELTSVCVHLPQVR